MKKRIGLSLLFIIILVSVWVFLHSKIEELPVYSNISVSDKMKEDHSYKLGSFQIDWNGSKKRFTITHEDLENHTVFSSPEKKGFLGGSISKMSAEEQRGSFDIEENRLFTCAKQTVTNMYGEKDKVVIEGTVDCANGATVPFQFSLTQTSDYQLQYNVDFENSLINRTYLTWETNKQEYFFGFGEQFSAFDLKGERLPIIVQEQGVGRGLQPLTFLADITNDGAGGDWNNTYAPVPHFISSELHSLYSENKEYQVFDLTDHNLAQLEVFSGQISGRIYAGDSPEALLAEHTSVVGRMNALPKWTQQGLILGVQGGTEEASRKLDLLLEHNVPVAGLWIQDWVGQRTTSFGKQLWWNWELDEDHYNNWDSFRKRLEARDIKLLGYINPFLVDTTEKDNTKRNLYNEAKEKDYLIKDDKGNPIDFQITSFSAGLVDLTHPEAREWMKEIIKNELVDNGFSGWMADFGEALPFDVKLHNGVMGYSFHNKYPEEWAKLNYEVLEELNMEQDSLIFVRAGFSESPQYVSSFWLGDQLVTWDHHDGMKTAVTGLLSSGLSGFSLNHSDIGGYTSVTNFPLSYDRSEELLLRWIELNAFTSLFRSHEGNRPDENLQIYSNDKLLKHVQKFGGIFKKLAPYRNELMEEVANSGAPLVRPLFFHYPHDSNTYKIEYEQFMLGRDMIIAPVLDEGTEALDVYLPEGDWVHLWSDKKYTVNKEGQYVNIKTPIGEPAIFYRDHSKVESILKN